MPYLQQHDSRPNLEIFKDEKEKQRQRPLPAGTGQVSITCSDLEFLKMGMDVNSSEMLDNQFPVVNRNRQSMSQFELKSSAESKNFIKKNMQIVNRQFRSGRNSKVQFQNVLKSP